MINQREWLQTRKNLLDQVKNQVRLRLGPLSPGLRRYAKSLDGDFRGGWKICSAAELKKALKKANVVLCADFHAYAQSQRAHLRLVRDHAGHANVTLALECISDHYDEQTAAFLDSLSEYNLSIAEYALTILPASTPADKLVSALVVKP